MAISLMVNGGGGASRSYADDSEVCIGRDPEKANFVLDSAYVSRLHCVLKHRHRGGWVIIHRGRNPSKLGGKCLRRPGEQAILPTNVDLTVGGVSIRVQIIGEDPPSDIVVRLDELDILDADTGWDSISEEDEDDERTILDTEVQPYDDLEGPSLETAIPEMPMGSVGRVGETAEAHRSGREDGEVLESAGVELPEQPLPDQTAGSGEQPDDGSWFSRLQGRFRLLFR